MSLLEHFFKVLSLYFRSLNLDPHQSDADPQFNSVMGHCYLWFGVLENVQKGGLFTPLQAFHLQQLAQLHPVRV
jgi:hypothetical protein